MMGLNFQLIALIVICLVQLLFFIRGAKFVLSKNLIPPLGSWLFFLLTLLAIVLVSELAGAPGIWIGRSIYFSCILFGIPGTIKFICSQRAYLLSSAFHRSCFLLFLFGLSFWTWMMRDLAFLSSVGDGVNHLFFYTRIRDSLHAFTSHIPLLRSQEFGSNFLGYYPSGFHSLVAIMSFPASWVLKTNPLMEIKAITLVVLGYFPVALFSGVYRLFERIGVWPAALSAVWAMLLEVFPLNPMGEGGVTRVVGHILAIHLVWDLIRRPLRTLDAFLLGSLVFPTFFWIHPASGVVIGIVFCVSFFKKILAEPKNRFHLMGWSALGASIGGCLIWAMLHLQTVGDQTAVIAQIFQSGQTLNWATWLDRMKGPIHFLLSDGAGYGKFLSPRILLAYFGMYLLFKNSDFKVIRPYFIVLFLLPFTLSMLVFSHFRPFVYMGLLFYHSVKRISELGFWPLFLGWVAGFSFLMNLARIRRGMSFALTLLFLSVVLVSGRKLNLSLKEFDQMYRSLSPEGVVQLLERFEVADRPDAIWYCKTADFQPLVSLKPSSVAKRLFFSIGTECQSTPANSEYCQKEHDYLEKSLEMGSSKFVALNQQGDGCTVIYSSQKNAQQNL